MSEIKLLYMSRCEVSSFNSNSLYRTGQIRRRKRRFRWLRRGGWVLVEWLLVGVMWYVWFMVVLTRVVMGVGKGVVGSLRWLFWLD